MKVAPAAVLVVVSASAACTAPFSPAEQQFDRASNRNTNGF